MEKIKIIPFNENGMPCSDEHAATFSLEVLDLYCGRYPTRQTAENIAESLFAGTYPNGWSQDYINLFHIKHEVWKDQEKKRLAALSADLEAAIRLDEELLDQQTEDLEQALWDTPTGAPE